MSHPPIPVHDLANHIDDLKMGDNIKFSQEYESIEPGQQVINYDWLKYCSYNFSKII